MTPALAAPATPGRGEPGTAAVSLPVPLPEGTMPVGSLASGTGTTEPAVKISAPGTFVLPVAPALPREAAEPVPPVLPAAPVLPGTSPQSSGGAARMAPVSAAAVSGLAGLEVSTKDASVVQPPVALAPMAAPAAPVAVAATGHTPAAAPQQLLSQVSQPLVRLAAAGPGEHVMTLSVNPENLGPVTVRAVISSEGVRVEMFAPTETAREALRHILVELRRDLAGASNGPAATLTLSDQNSPDNGSGGGAAQADDRSGRAATASAEPVNLPAAGLSETSPQRSGPTGATTALDVMA
ncbi:flagellar hook-length control protein FliK [Arthrobacter sp. Z1-15]